MPEDRPIVIDQDRERGSGCQVLERGRRPFRPHSGRVEQNDIYVLQAFLGEIDRNPLWVWTEGEVENFHFSADSTKQHENTAMHDNMQL